MERKWWKQAVAYQAYVRSFKDSDGDGVGDLRGIIEKLDYLKELGVDILYMNPINKSPNDDNGYDISDFKDIMDEFGNLNDFDELVEGLHKRGMKIVMDLVINHSSDEHPWFIESRKSKDNPYRDYYMWHPGVAGGPPNNWGSLFGGSSWEYDEQSGEYYFHLFSKKQPDFNWRNAELREALKDVVRYWVEKGIDGVRMDAINHIEKDQSYPNGIIRPGDVYGDLVKYVRNLPEVHSHIKELRRDVFGDGEHVVIGEASGMSYDNAFVYTGEDRKELDMIFHFDMESVGKGEKAWERRPIDLVKDIKEKFVGWQNMQLEEGWFPVFFSNHDTTRTVSRLGDDKEYWAESAKMLVTLQMTLRGTPFVYYGDEIGMTNPEGFELEDYRDVQVFNKYKDLVKSGMVSEENYLLGLYHTSRDNSRTPMQWSPADNGGFSTAKPWIKLNSNYSTINVEEQMSNPNSIFNYYKSVIALRKANDVLVYGGFKELNNAHPEIFCYIRELNGIKILVILNFFGNTPVFETPEDIDTEGAELLISNYEVADSMINSISLRPYETRVYKLK